MCEESPGSESKYYPPTAKGEGEVPGRLIVQHSKASVLKREDTRGENIKTEKKCYINAHRQNNKKQRFGEM